MKGQDLLLLFKLICLDQRRIDNESSAEACSVRSLEATLGVSKSEVAAALKRCQSVMLLRVDPATQRFHVNKSALLGFIEHGVRYVFPVRPAEITRGMPTGFAAPVLAGKLMSAGDLIPVWPDALGTHKGMAVKPLFKSVPEAARKDALLYEYLALVDAIRMGGPRETRLAGEMLRERAGRLSVPAPNL